MSSAPLEDAATPSWRAVLFGKLPSHGDFVCRGMREEERAAWDGWTCEGVDAARLALGDAFDAAHAVAPPWRFVSGPGPFGDRWRAGCISPSADRAGRRFVIVLAAEGLDWAEAVSYGPGLADALTDAIYRIFAERQDADKALETIQVCMTRPETQRTKALAKLASPLADGVWWSEGGESHVAALETGAAPDAGSLMMRVLAPSPAEPPS